MQWAAVMTQASLSSDPPQNTTLAASFTMATLDYYFFLNQDLLTNLRERFVIEASIYMDEL